MTAALASIGPIGWVAAVVGSLCLYAGLVIGVGRFCAMSDPGEVDTQPAAYPPPVPPSQPRLATDDDADWLASWPADTPISVIEAAYYDKEFLAIPEVAADMRWSV